MNRRHFYILLICSFIAWWPGIGLMPLLPIYTAQLGASPAMVGNYLAFIFFALAVGTASIGWIASRFQNRRALLGMLSLVAVPATWLMGQVTEVWQLLLLNAVVWFVSGACVALIGILAGLGAAKHERGKIFGMLALTTALAGVLGGAMGPIADQWGYPTLFALVACIWLVQIALSPFLYERRVAPESAENSESNGQRGRLGTAFLLLVGANSCYAIGSFMGILGRSMAMDVEGFTATAISGVAAIGSIAGLVLSPWIGRLSDRYDRRWLLALTYVCSGLSLGILAMSTSFFEFSVVAVIVAVAGTERAVSAALVTDLLPPQSLDRGMSLFDTVRWAGGIFGFAGTGYAVQLLGLKATMLLGVLLPVLALIFLAWMYWPDPTVYDTFDRSISGKMGKAT